MLETHLENTKTFLCGITFTLVLVTCKVEGGREERKRSFLAMPYNLSLEMAKHLIDF